MLSAAKDEPAHVNHSHRLRIHRLAHSPAPHDQQAEGDFAADVRAGLSAHPKQLFPKYFYDELGSQLFDAICLLPEYYLTRAENEIFMRDAEEIVQAFYEIGHRDFVSDLQRREATVTLLELGSGSAVKTRRLIEALFKRQQELLYIPVDISASALETSARLLLQSYPGLRINAYASDYETALAQIRADETLDQHSRLLSLFLGSNIGNFDRAAAREFLRAFRRHASRPGDALLIGVDLKKAPSVLEAAYDDALGITAAFNLNLLARLNRELHADFDLRAFQHVAFYNEAEGRIEIYIESRRAQQVYIPKLDMQVTFAAGERIHTENSYKYDLTELTELASSTGFTRARTWFDRQGQFSSNLFIATE